MCDGYGIWGGGGNAYDSDLRIFMSRLSNAYAPLGLCYSNSSTSAADFDEEARFDFFERRTSIKLPGLFDSDFWETIVIQISLTEPAVFYAATALASLQKNT